MAQMYPQNGSMCACEGLPFANAEIGSLNQTPTETQEHSLSVASSSELPPKSLITDKQESGLTQTNSKPHMITLFS